jgi:hypothetical protein
LNQYASLGRCSITHIPSHLKFLHYAMLIEWNCEIIFVAGYSDNPSWQSVAYEKTHC